MDERDTQIGLLEDKLEALLGYYEGRSPYDVFGLWKGCGRALVRERYYTLVKENHPDRYGGNVSGRVKSLSQEIFLIIQRARAKLERVEKEQTAHEPDAARQRAIETLQSTFPGHHGNEFGGDESLSQPSEVFEAETISTRTDTDTMRDDSRLDEERRAKARRARAIE